MTDNFKRRTGIDDRTIQMFKAVANPVRLRMVSLLGHRQEMTAQQFAAELDISQSSLFEHLANLRDSGWIAASGESNPANRYYCLNPDSLAFMQAVIGGWGESGESSMPAHPNGISVRAATTADADAIATIYNQGIEDRVATLETTLRDAAERAAWLDAKGSRYPVLVAVDTYGSVLGWGSLNQFNPRPAYDHVVDISVYVERGQRGKGIGDTLIKALDARARELGYHKLVLAAFPTNAPGMRLYQRNGFSTVGIYHEQGRLDDRWVDTIVMEKLLS